MGTQHFFEQALASFTFETACGGAIRHLADNGYTVKQITERLDFPASCEQVRDAVFQHFCDTGVILLGEPEYDSIEEKPEFVREYDQYGKASFRRVTAKTGRKKLMFQESRFLSGSPDEFLALLNREISLNGNDSSYISCDFGLWATSRLAGCGALDRAQREYLTGLPWPASRVFHRLDPRMKAIAVNLFGALDFSGCCYFLKTGEKVTIV